MNKLLLTIFTALVASAMAFSASAQDIKGDAKAGMQKNAMCIGCHGIAGYQANFPEVYKVPMISGQNAKFIVASLNAYKKGERKHPSMRAIAGSLTDQDMADLAAYYELDGMDRGTSKSASASMVLPVPGSPLTSSGRLRAMAALTASFRSWVATYWEEPWNFILGGFKHEVQL